MNSDQRKNLYKAIDLLVKLLVEEKYSEIALLTKNRRLNEDQIRGAIMEYGGTLIIPSPPFHESVDIVRVRESQPQRWSVDFPVWTLEEGESDLSVEITCIDHGNSEYDIELDSIHVL